MLVIRTLGSMGLMLLALVVVPVAFAVDNTGIVTGLVIHASVMKYPTLVYVDEVSTEVSAPPGHATIDLKRKSFVPSVLPVRIGTTVDFVNTDTKKHGVFSLDGEKYDLGEWGKGEKHSYTFNEPGVYTQLCSRHPEALGYIVVLETPYFAFADGQGRFRIPDIPAGTGKLKIWNAALAFSQTRKSHDVNVTPGEEVRVNVGVAPLPPVGKFWTEPPPPATAAVVERGAWLYRQRGCFLCHGEDGAGGVRNRNYVKGTIPPLDNLAEKILLYDPEDVTSIVALMEKGRNLENFAHSPPVPRFEAVLAKYQSVRDLIEKGGPSGKMHAKGPVPPFVMPGWKRELSRSDIDALIAYLLTLQAWNAKER